MGTLGDGEGPGQMGWELRVKRAQEEEFSACGDPRALGMALPWELVLSGSVHPFALTVCRCEGAVEAQDGATCGPR